MLKENGIILTQDFVYRVRMPGRFDNQVAEKFPKWLKSTVERLSPTSPVGLKKFAQWKNNTYRTYFYKPSESDEPQRLFIWEDSRNRKVRIAPEIGARVLSAAQKIKNSGGSQ
jgi:hypothetical protein